MADTKFEPGDVVILKSGGPTMTVEEQHDNGRVVCTWFNNNDVKRDGFNAAQLEKYDPRF